MFEMLHDVSSSPSTLTFEGYQYHVLIGPLSQGTNHEKIHMPMNYAESEAHQIASTMVNAG